MSAFADGLGRDRVLVAGVGNIFLSDDGFGVEVVRRLSARQLPEQVELRDIGVRGVHLAYQLLDGYREVVLVDATARGAEPGTVYVIDAGDAQERRNGAQAPAMDGHHMSPDAVLALLGTLHATVGGSQPRRVRVVGCEPAVLEEGIGLSAPVAAAVDRAVDLVAELVAELVDEEVEPVERVREAGRPADLRSHG